MEVTLSISAALIAFGWVLAASVAAYTIGTSEAVNKNASRFTGAFWIVSTALGLGMSFLSGYLWP